VEKTEIKKVIKGIDDTLNVAGRIAPIPDDVQAWIDQGVALRSRYIELRQAENAKLKENGWIHRIDAVPAPGTFVYIKQTLSPGKDYKAEVVPASKPLRFSGIGGDVEYRVGSLRMHAGLITHWKPAYLGEPKLWIGEE
jgi:hypothetical protein